MVIFKNAIQQAAKWIKQENTRTKVMKKEHFEERAMWKLKAAEQRENVKKVRAKLNEARILQENLLAQVYSKLVEQGKISEAPSKMTEDQGRLGQESKVSIQKSGSIDKYTRDLILQLIN